MRIAVVGAGGTGGYFGGLLARAGQDVTFIARGAHLEALRARGLTVESKLAGTFTVPLQATDAPSEVAPVDLILFCVKTYDTNTAAESIRPLIRPDTMLISLKNGIANEERIARAVGYTSRLGAVAYVVFRRSRRRGSSRKQPDPGRSYSANCQGARVRARSGCVTCCKGPG